MSKPLLDVEYSHLDYVSTIVPVTPVQCANHCYLESLISSPQAGVPNLVVLYEL
jgi:hypothetical protein